MLPPRVSAAHQVVLLSLVVCGTTSSSTTTSAGTGADAVAESAGAGHDTLIFTTSQERVASCLCCQYLFRILVSRNTLEEGYDFSWRVAWLRVTELPKWSRPLPHPAPPSFGHPSWCSHVVQSMRSHTSGIYCCCCTHANTRKTWTCASRIIMMR